MQDKIKAVAERIQELRELEGLTTAQMADNLSMAHETYVSFEEGTADIPASVLYEIAAVLHVDIGLLLTGREPHMHSFSVTRKGKGAAVERREAYTYQNLAANFIHARSEPFLVTVEPKDDDSTPPPQAHPGQEFDYVLEGRMAFCIKDQEIILEEGDSIYIDSACPHSIRALDQQPVRILAVIIPA